MVHIIKGYNAAGEEIVAANSTCLNEKESSGDMKALKSYLLGDYADWLALGWNSAPASASLSRQDWTLRVNDVVRFEVAEQ